MSEFNIESMHGFYQVFDAERMERIQPALEIMCWHDSHSFFSPVFKTSKIVVDYILKKYSGKASVETGKQRENVQKGLVTRYEIQRNGSLYKNYLDRFEKINSSLQTRLKAGNVLAYFEDQYGTRCIYMLMEDRLVSDYRDDHGKYFNYLIGDIKIVKHGIYNRKGRCLVSGSSFSKEFMDLFQELNLLGKKTEMKRGSHPLLKEGRATRARYLEILIDKCFFDNYLSADEVIRLEIMARQFGISSSMIKQEMKEAIGRSKYKNAYLEWAVQKINDIPKGYYYALIQDIIVLEAECLASDYGKRESISEFLNRVAVRCGFADGTVDKWFHVIQDFMRSSYNFRKMKEEIKNNSKNTFDKKNINDSVTYEYHMQESMLGR